MDCFCNWLMPFCIQKVLKNCPKNIISTRVLTLMWIHGWTAFVIIDRCHASSSIHFIQPPPTTERLSGTVAGFVTKIVQIFIKNSSRQMSKKSSNKSFCNNWLMPCFVFHPLHLTKSNHRKSLLHCGQKKSTQIRPKIHSLFLVSSKILSKHLTKKLSKRILKIQYFIQPSPNWGFAVSKRYLLFSMKFDKK